MRLPDSRMDGLTGSFCALLLLASAASAATAIARDRAPTSPPVSGPAADYPVVVGEPFTIGSTVWTPLDQLNYDAVGSAVTESGEGGVTAAHKTLPLPSYVEVTALDSGKTALVRVERRGPMTNEALIELSPDASSQLGLVPGAIGQVRVRRVNPPEQERELLRAGQRAPDRMATPEGLLKVLRRKLQGQSPLLPPPSAPPAMPRHSPDAAVPPQERVPPVAPATLASQQPRTPVTPKPPVAPAAVVAPQPRDAGAGVAHPRERPAPPLSPQAKALPRQAPASRIQTGGSVVQVGSFASEANARLLATRLGGRVSRSGRFWRVQLGPYESRAKAAPALEKAKRAGYSDARIQSVD